jgi:hypothetical protein
LFRQDATTPAFFLQLLKSLGVVATVKLLLAPPKDGGANEALILRINCPGCSAFGFANLAI